MRNLDNFRQAAESPNQKSLKPKVIFNNTTPLYFFSSNITTFYKSSPSKCKFSDFPLLGLKFTNFLMSFFQTKSQIFFKLWTIFSIMKHNSLVFFNLNLYMLWTKGSNQSAIFQTFSCSHRN